MKLKKSLSIILTISTFCVAEVDLDSINLDENISLDSNETQALKAKDREGYMPNIITPEYAKSGIYGGLALGGNSLKFSNSSNRMLSLSLIAGYNFNSYLATESRATLAIANEKSIDYKNISVFLKPQYEVYKGINLYTLIGVGKFSANSINSNATKGSSASMQFGLGAGYKLENNFKLFADYTYLGNDNKAKYKNSSTIMKSSAVTAGIMYDF